jgi:hypothetical protein
MKCRKKHARFLGPEEHQPRLFARRENYRLILVVPGAT